jgi:AbiV family abortive infection protein
MPAPDLTIQDLLLLAPAAARNARDLLADAEILLERQRWPRAHALAVLAGEEASKAYTCVCGVAFGAQAVSRHGLEKGHNRKLILARVVTHHVIPLAEWGEELLTRAPLTPTELVEMASQDNKSKQHALYVDIRADGSLQQPSDISEAEAKSAVSSVIKLINWVVFLTSDDMLNQLSNGPDGARDSRTSSVQDSTPKRAS